MTVTAPVAAPTRTTWAITTTDGHTVAGHLPDWAETDPSRTGVPPQRLSVELADITHQATSGGHIVSVSRGADPAEQTPVLVATIDCKPYPEDDAPAHPVANIQLVDDIWIRHLDPAGVTTLAGQLQAAAHHLTTTVGPALTAARTDWADR